MFSAKENISSDDETTLDRHGNMYLYVRMRREANLDFGYDTFQSKDFCEEFICFLDCWRANIN